MSQEEAGPGDADLRLVVTQLEAAPQEAPRVFSLDRNAGTQAVLELDWIVNLKSQAEGPPLRFLQRDAAVLRAGGVGQRLHALLEPGAAGAVAGEV